MNAIQKFIEAEHKYLDLKEIDYKEYEQTITPLRDVECVVRCKDCRKRGTIMCHLWFNSPMPKDSWYCADGERR